MAEAQCARRSDHKATGFDVAAMKPSMPAGSLWASHLVVRAPSVTGMIGCAVSLAGLEPFDHSPDGFGAA